MVQKTRNVSFLLRCILWLHKAGKATKGTAEQLTDSQSDSTAQALDKECIYFEIIEHVRLKAAAWRPVL